MVGTGLVAGLPVLDASRSGDKLLSRPRGTGKFLKATFDAARQQHIDGPWSAYLAANGQESSAVLLSSEEIGLGGARFGRAYDPSEVTGSRGVAGSLELRYDDTVRAEGEVVGYQLYGFVDYGRCGPLRRPVERPRYAGIDRGRRRLGWRGQFFGETELAFPLTRGVATNGGRKDGPRMFFASRRCSRTERHLVDVPPSC